MLPLLPLTVRYTVYYTLYLLYTRPKASVERLMVERGGLWGDKIVHIPIVLSTIMPSGVI